jgi:hypothetical protein
MLLRNRHSLWVRLAFALGAMGLFVFGYQWGNQYQRKTASPPQIDGVLIRPPIEVPDFRLEDTTGRPFTAGDLEPGWTLLAFGDLAGAGGQLAVQRLIDLYNRAGEEPALQRALTLALVTPGEPSPLARDFARLSPALRILTGDPAEGARLRAALGAGSAPDASLYVFAPGGYLIALLADGPDRAATGADLIALHDGLFLLLPEGTP